MSELSAELVIAVGGAALFTALAFKYQADTVIKLNQELQETLRERQRDETERDLLKQKIEALETELATYKTLNEQ